ncbi:MAG: hypothetical protein HN547_10315 [Chloroflexi bacterium]|nr:hypothetical protein [Chloroflexota bacterium]MBT7217523.1 hypothetical protein [Chloroflexota bacterium]
MLKTKFTVLLSTRERVYLNRLAKFMDISQSAILRIGLNNLIDKNLDSLKAKDNKGGDKGI